MGPPFTKLSIYCLQHRLEAPSAETIGLLRCHRLLEVAAKLENVAGVVKLGENGWEAGQVVEGSDRDDLMVLVERLEAELLEDIESSEEEPEWEASPQVIIPFPVESWFCLLLPLDDKFCDRRNNRPRGF